MFSFLCMSAHGQPQAAAELPGAERKINSLSSSSVPGEAKGEPFAADW
jgi:hypothetical protein